MYYDSAGFESETTGALPAGWTNVGAADFKVHTSAPPTGSKAFGEINGATADNHICYYATLADQNCAMQFVQYVNFVTSTQLPTGSLLRFDPTGNNGYLILPDWVGNGMTLYKLVSGTYSQVGSTVSIPAYTAADNVILKAEVFGTTTTTVRFRIWLKGASEPGTWTGTWTDSSSPITAAGYGAVRTGKAGSIAGNTILDDLYIGPSGSTFPIAAGATTFTLTGPSAGPAGAASGVFTVTPDAAETGTFTPTPVSGCTFSPSTLTWAGTSEAKTFTVTKSAAGGPVSINGTFSNSLTPPASVSYTAKTTYSRTLSVSGSAAGHTVHYALKNDDGTYFKDETASGVVDQGGGVYSVVANVPIDDAGLVVWTDTTTSTVTGEALRPALALTITADGSNHPVLTWTASPGAVHYLVLRSATAQGAPSLVAVVAAPTLTYTDTSITGGTQFYAIVATLG